MKYLNQLEYPHIPYRTRVKVEGLTEQERQRTVARSGCGLCCACMTVDLLTDKELPLEECVKLSEACVANHAVGTDMSVLGPALAEKFDLCYENTSDLDTAIRHLQRGGVIIAHVHVGDGREQGLFTKGGHYISLIATDGAEFCILDPSYTAQKFKTPDRIGKVDESKAPYLYCDVHITHAEAHDTKPKYHLFSRGGTANE